MVIHLTGLKNADDPGVLLFPKLLVCLDGGFLSHIVPARKLASLSDSISKSECPADQLAWVQECQPGVYKRFSTITGKRE
jgi:hypothetical protein